jgi:hypothetical protein
VNLDDVYASSTWPGFYTDSGASGLGIFRQDTGWTGYVPAVRFEVETVPPWTIKGFYQPVDMSPSNSVVFNTVKGGSTVPLKFEIFNGDTELTDPAAVSTISQLKVNCAGGTDIELEQELATSTTSVSIVRYDASAGQFIFNWKTPKGKDACYKVTMTTTNGPAINAYFKLK